ncbi:50S ribosomal protein L17 [Patescibacteria group bacterium]|nr:50S ribosomal protein L17 [Patescibacteria group bacterium]MBU1682592.1 50S ribosomal protein L17 [Patescibacteria group bacterium]MBU1935669.1 50S ribosomal protein L17 [Patescibacteria group bacterium]
MRHRVKTTRLNRKEAHLNSMLRNLATSIVLYEKVKTTRPKAKMVKPIIEKLITTVKKQSLPVAMRTLNSYFTDKNASKKLAREILERYKDRNSGYLRVTPLGFRTGDAANMVQIELV